MAARLVAGEVRPTGNVRSAAAKARWSAARAAADSARRYLARSTLHAHRVAIGRYRLAGAKRKIGVRNIGRGRKWVRWEGRQAWAGVVVNHSASLNFREGRVVIAIHDGEGQALRDFAAFGHAVQSAGNRRIARRILGAGRELRGAHLFYARPASCKRRGWLARENAFGRRALTTRHRRAVEGRPLRYVTCGIRQTDLSRRVHWRSSYNDASIASSCVAVSSLNAHQILPAASARDATRPETNATPVTARKSR